MKPLIGYGSDVSASRPARLVGDKTSVWTYSRLYFPLNSVKRLTLPSDGMRVNTDERNLLIPLDLPTERVGAAGSRPF
jgi:hypothetical protein